MLSVERGALHLYFCFDVGEEIHLARVERVFGEAPESSRLVARRVTPAHIQYRQAPLLVRLADAEIDTPSGKVAAACTAKLYGFGVITISLRVPLRGPLEGLAPLAIACVESAALLETARERLASLLREIGSAVETVPADRESAGETDWEDYAIFRVERFDRPVRSDELLETARADIARLLTCETEPLSATELADATRVALSYYADELAVLGWNAAFLYDPRASWDVADVLEYAVVMLLELRTYDALLDRVLDRAYDDLERKGGLLRPRDRGGLLRVRPFASTIDYLSEVKLEVSEVVEKATNALKLVGDPYLARVFQAMATRFGLSAWEHNLREKLATVESLYTLLHDRMQSRVMLALESAIVVLFVVDVVLVLLQVAK